MGDRGIPSLWLDWFPLSDPELAKATAKTYDKEHDSSAARSTGRSPQYKFKCVHLDTHRPGETCEAWVNQNFQRCRLHTKVLLIEAIRLNTRLWREQRRYGITHPTAEPDWPTCFREALFRSEAFFIALSVRVLRLAFKARVHYWLGQRLRRIWALEQSDGSFRNRDDSSGSDDGDGDVERAGDVYYTAWLYSPD